MSKPSGGSALMLAPEAPYPLAGGGPMRTASVLEYLRHRYNLEVITFREPGARDPRPLFPEDVRVDVIDLPFHGKSSTARAVRNLRRFASGVPPLVDRFSGFDEEIGWVVEGRRYDLAVIEHFWCGPYASILRPVSGKLALNLHNVESELLSTCGKAGGGLSSVLFDRWARSCARLERELLPQFDVVLTTSEADAARIPVPSTVLPNTIPYVPQPERPKRREVVFSGNLEYHPNTTAVQWFAREIWPSIRKRCPDVAWRILGKNDQVVRRYVERDDRVILTGPVDDAVGALAECTVAVVPLKSGSGTRIKIIEAWAAGLPVVSTRIGAEGLPGKDGKHLLIADDAAAFVEGTVNVLQNSDLQSQLGSAGRRLYRSELTWDSAWKVLKRAGL